MKPGELVTTTFNVKNSYSFYYLHRKLTPEQRKEKNLKKLMEDTSLETKVAVYRVTDLSDPRHLFKVTKNAQQRMLTGCVVITPKFSVVVVEVSRSSLSAFSNIIY